MIELTCQGCGGTFLRNKHQHNANIKRGRKIVACSLKCIPRARGHGGLATAICLNCTREFSRKKTSHDTLKFCSKSCSAKYNNPLQIVRASPKLCNTCKVSTVYGRRKVCDSCKESNKYHARPDWSSITLNDLKNKYSISQYHAKIRGMSRSEYAKNNGLMQCVICEYKTHVDIAHIKAVKDFDLNTTLDVVNHISNLTALCPNHHWEFDHNIITL